MSLRNVDDKVTLARLAEMKKSGEKIVAIVAWDYQIARIADHVGVEIVSVGDTVGVNLWGHANPLEVTLDQMIVVAQAVRRGVDRALVSCDFPFGPLQQGSDVALAAALRLTKECGVDLVKLDGASDYPESVSALDRAGIPVFAQFGITPQTAHRHGIAYDPAVSDGQVPEAMLDELVEQARTLERAGAALLDFTNSGPAVGRAVAESVSIPVLGGFGGGPWLDGRVRMAHAAIGYAARFADDEARDAYANVAKITRDSLIALSADIRASKQIRGGIPVPDADRP